jgi:predicted transcriptional regulator/DNA-binding XRE family transcriptional regulator
MAVSGLTGSRIRERRSAVGIRQADLARAVGISPSYLNLIEHNRRRIGGKLLVDLARELSVEPAHLSEGAEAAVLSQLRDAAARQFGAAETQAAPELDRAEELVGRLPGWAGLVNAQARRVSELERLVETLSDRLTHDPQLAASLHEMLSSVTAIRSASSILTETRDIDPDWQARFLRNVREESQRLSDSAEGLVAYLDSGGDLSERPLSPSDELAAFIEAAGYHFAPLESDRAGEPEIETLLAGSDTLRDPGAVAMARDMLMRYLADRRAMPAGPFEASRAATDDPGRLADAFGVGPDAVLRRIASLTGADSGLVACDGSGTLTLRKPVAGFSLPRFGAACPLWPLYRALVRPSQPVTALVEMPGRVRRRFLCHAICTPRAATGFSAPMVFEATMLILPAADAGGPADPVGSTCRICPRDGCAARREPSIIGDQV